MLGKDYAGQDCSLARALEVVGERWTLLILRDAFLGVRRFSDFAAHLDVPRAVLSDRLRGLVDDGLLERRGDLYELTADGRALWPALHALTRYGERFHDAPRQVRRYLHAECGTRLDARGVCPRCGIAPRPQDVATQPGRAARRDDDVTAALRPRRRLLQPVR